MNAATESTAGIAAPAPSAVQTRPFYWSVKRELWEHRSLYSAPLIAAAVILIGFLFNALNLSEGLQALTDLPPQRQRVMVSGFYGMVAMVIAMVMAVTAWFYSLDALHTERRDRSVLFWKSLPISDTTAVLSKLFTASIVAGAIAFVVALITQLLILLLGTIILAARGESPLAIWNNLQMFQLTIALIYGLIVMALWYAPVYAWLLLVSAWAKRSTFLWAVMPPLGIVGFEKLAFDTGYSQRLLFYRLYRGLETAFEPRGHMHRRDLDMHLDGTQPVLQILDPIGFLTNPYLWVGLVVAAGLIVAAIWMRRYREPI